MIERVPHDLCTEPTDIRSLVVGSLHVYCGYTQSDISLLALVQSYCYSRTIISSDQSVFYNAIAKTHLKKKAHGASCLFKHVLEFVINHVFLNRNEYSCKYILFS